MLVWAPAVETMYPQGFATQIVPQGPAKVGLEDAFRPHFFAGVATVVAKLLIQCAPDIALFGEKDFQQLKVVTRLARDLDLPVKIIGVPIVRETDGLAMSSRNAYLSAAERATAPTLYRVLKDCAARIAAGEQIARVLDEGGRAIEQAGFALDYLEARHAETLGKVESADAGPLRLLVAAKLGRTRLIDNVAVRSADALQQTQFAQFPAERLRHGLGARSGVVEVARHVLDLVDSASPGTLAMVAARPARASARAPS